MKNICAQTIFEGLTAVETSEIFINTRQSIRLAIVTIEEFVSITRLTYLAVLLTSLADTIFSLKPPKVVAKFHFEEFCNTILTVSVIVVQTNRRC